MRCWSLVLVACGCAKDPSPPAGPPPWTSGTRIRAQTYTSSSGEVVGLAGRHDTMLDWSCPVDTANPPQFTACPPQAWLYYRAFDCSVHDVVRGRDNTNVVTKFAVAPDAGSDHYFATTQPTTEPITAPDSMGTCTVPATGPDEYLVTEIDPATLALGSLVPHTDHGIAYTSLETADGFAVIVSVDGGHPTTDTTTGRIAATYSTAGHVSAFAGMVDTMTGEPCYAATDTAGQLRCLPKVVDVNAGPVLGASSDAQCRQFSAYVSKNPILATLDTHQAGYAHVVRCDTPATVPMYTVVPLPMGGCVPVAAAQMCTELPIDSFEPLALVTE